MNIFSYYLTELTGGDRIAGEGQILAKIITSVKVELLLECTSDKLSQIVGRLKSKSASIYFANRNREEEKHTWSKGFWYTQLLDTISQQIVQHYFNKHSTTKAV